MSLATLTLWNAAGRPAVRGAVPCTSACWWCGMDAPGLGVPVDVAVADSFSDAPLARNPYASHVCAPCAWTMQTGMDLPPALAAERLTNRLSLKWKGNRRAAVCLRGPDGEWSEPMSLIVLGLQDGRIATWTPAKNAAAEAASLGDAALLERMTHEPADMGPMALYRVVDAADIKPGPERFFFTFHHFAVPHPNGGTVWEVKTDSDKAWMRHHLLRTDLYGAGVSVLSVEKKHSVIHAAAEMHGVPGGRSVFFAGVNVGYEPDELAELIGAVEHLVLAGAGDAEILSGHYDPRDMASLTARTLYEPIVAPMRGHAMLALALHLRRPRAEIVLSPPAMDSAQLTDDVAAPLAPASLPHPQGVPRVRVHRIECVELDQPQQAISAPVAPAGPGHAARDVRPARARQNSQLGLFG